MILASIYYFFDLKIRLVFEGGLNSTKYGTYINNLPFTHALIYSGDTTISFSTMNIDDMISTIYTKIQIHSKNNKLSLKVL